MDPANPGDSFDFSAVPIANEEDEAEEDEVEEGEVEEDEAEEDEAEEDEVEEGEVEEDEAEEDEAEEDEVEVDGEMIDMKVHAAMDDIGELSLEDDVVDADGERNANSKYESTRHSMPGIYSGEGNSAYLAPSGNNGYEVDSPSKFLDVQASNGKTAGSPTFKPLEPISCASDAAEMELNEPHSHGSSNWEDQYYVDRIEGFEGRIPIDSGGELSNPDITNCPADQIAMQAGFNNPEYSLNELQTNNDNPPAVKFKQPMTAKLSSSEAPLIQNFLSTGLNDESNFQIKYQQMCILYSARGRELDRLKYDLETCQKASVEERESLMRQLKEAQDNAYDCAIQYQENQEKLMSTNSDIAMLTGQIRAMEVELSAVDDNRKDVIQKLQSAESTIESLQVHIGELESSESMARAKEQHVAIVNSIQEKHKNEIYCLKSEIDQFKEKLSHRDQEVTDLSKKFDMVNRELETAKIEKAETVNRLIRALEQSQQECEKLIQTSQRTDAAALEIGNKIPGEDRIAEALRNELQATKQELELFLSSANLGIVAQCTTGSQPCLSQVDRSSSPNFRLGSVKHDSLITSLKGEVERSLVCLQRKSDQLKKSQHNYQTTLRKIKDLQENEVAKDIKLHAAEMKVLDLSEQLKKLAENCNKKVATADREMHQAFNAKCALEEQLKRRNIEITEISKSKSLLNDLVRKLKEEMENLREDHEVQTREAVEECRETCLRLHSDTNRALREECNRQLEETRLENVQRVESLTHDLDNVKSLYVKVCEEKDVIEDRILKECQEERNNEIEKLKKVWTVIKDEEVKDAKERLLRKNESQNKCGPECFGSSTNQLEACLEKAKKVWKKEHDLLVEGQVLSRVKEVVKNFLTGKANDQADVAIDENLEQIAVLENRVKETEDIYKRHIADLEMTMKKANLKEVNFLKEKLLKKHKNEMKELEARLHKEADAKLKLMQQRCALEKEQAMKLLAEEKTEEKDHAVKLLLSSVDRSAKTAINSEVIDQQCRKAVEEAVVKCEREGQKALMELELQKDLVSQERLQALAIAKDKELQIALNQMEQKFYTDLEQFLVDQRQRYMSSLQNMRDSHDKEKVELQANYDLQIKRLNEECQNLLETQRNVGDVSRDKQKLDADEKNKTLTQSLRAEKEKCQKLETESSAQAIASQRQLREKTAELEDIRSRFDDALASAKREQHELLVEPLTKEVALLKARTLQAQELEAQQRLKLVTVEQKHQDLTTEHKTLKDKVKKYHRYIHSKEKEFAATLVQLNAEHSVALERITLLRSEVPQIFDEKLDQLRKAFLQTILSSNPQQREANLVADADQRSVKKMVDDSVIDELLDKFVLSLKRIHADTLQHLDECSKRATNRIREEISLAMCLMSKHLVTPTLSGGSSQTLASKLELPGHSSPQGLEATSKYSSGRGTMIDRNSEAGGTAVDTPRNGSGQTPSAGASGQLASGSLPWPTKYWSSTPYQREPIGLGTNSSSTKLPSRKDGYPLWTPDVASKIVSSVVNQRLMDFQEESEAILSDQRKRFTNVSSTSMCQLSVPTETKQNMSSNLPVTAESQTPVSRISDLFGRMGPYPKLPVVAGLKRHKELPTPHRNELNDWTKDDL